MAFYVKVIPPSKRARIHKGDCKHCRDGQGQENQDKGAGPTFWSAPFDDLADAGRYMDSLAYVDTGECKYCKPSVSL